MPDPAPKKPTVTVAKPVGWERSLAEINATIRKAEAGDKTALEEVRELLKPSGACDTLGGNLAAEAMKVLVRTHAGQNPVIRESITRKLEEMRIELSGQNPTSIEKLLVDRVLATWLHLHHMEIIFGKKEGYSFAAGAFYQKSISAAQKRYLTAIKGLAEVRKLALPALQVNIAKKQINVAAGTVASSASN